MEVKELSIYVGYDPKESVSWHVLVQSLMESSSVPLSIKPVYLKNYKNCFTRLQDTRQSNDFSFSRFLVPYLMNYEGYALFLDCDMLLKSDVKVLFDLAMLDPDKAVHVVKHDYTPTNGVKYLGQTQYSYPRKNWSSVVLWNCSHPANKRVDLDFVNTGTGADLHRFTWLNDDEIGELEVSWNWLVGEYDTSTLDRPVNNIHWTVGGPYFNEYRHVDFADDWYDMKNRMLRCDQLEDKQ